MSDAVQTQAPQRQGATVTAGSSGCSWLRGLAAARFSPGAFVPAAPAGPAAAPPCPPGGAPSAEPPASQPPGSLRPAGGSTQQSRLPLSAGVIPSARGTHFRGTRVAPSSAAHRLLLGLLPVAGAGLDSVGVPGGAPGSGGSWRGGGVPGPGAAAARDPAAAGAGPPGATPAAAAEPSPAAQRSRPPTPCACPGPRATRPSRPWGPQSRPSALRGRLGALWSRPLPASRGWGFFPGPGARADRAPGPGAPGELLGAPTGRSP